jgi:hypothetical protein
MRISSLNVVSGTAHFLINFNRFGQVLLVHVVNLGHVPFPVVFARECLASSFRIVTVGKGAVKLLLLLMAVVDVSLQVRFCSKTLATVLVRAFVLLGVVALVMPGPQLACCIFDAI